jgi:hypothetical protein
MVTLKTEINISIPKCFNSLLKAWLLFKVQAKLQFRGSKNQANGDNFVAEVLGEVIAHFHAVDVIRHSSMLN